LQATLPSVRLGLAAMLAEAGHEVVPSAAADEAVVRVIDAPDLVTLDSWLGSPVDRPTGPAVVLTDESSAAGRQASAGLPGGACLGRDADPAELDLAVRAAEAGLVLLDLPVAANLTTPVRSLPANPTELIDPLTPRELQVLQLVAQGQPNKGIARALGISENTAKFHVASLSAKLGAAGRAEAVAIGARLGLIVL
jgi:DNA-binding NarL/FixJ family response regulator